MAEGALPPGGMGTVIPGAAVPGAAGPGPVPGAVVAGGSGPGPIPGAVAAGGSGPGSVHGSPNASDSGPPGASSPFGALPPSWQSQGGPTPWQPTPDSGPFPRPRSSRMPWVLAVVAMLAVGAAGVFVGRWQQRAQVLHDVVEVEKRWNQANIRADRQALGEVLSDRYHHEGTGPKGEKLVQGKKDLVDGAEAKPGVKRWQLSDTRLVDLSADRAVLSGIFTEFGDGFEKRYEFTDTFVLEGGRWVAIDSEWKSATVAK